MIPENQKKILIILITIFSVSLIYRLINPYKQERVEKLTFTGNQNISQMQFSENNNKDSVYELLKTRLITEPPIHSGTIINNRFFRKIPGIKPSVFQKDLKSKTVIDKKIPGNEIPQPLPEPVETPEDVINRELAKFQVIGLYSGKHGLAIFLKRQKQIIVIRKGDRIDGKYLVKDITKEAVTLKAEHLNDTVHIDLSRFLKPYEKDQLPDK